MAMGVEVRMESWLAADTIRRMGFGHVVAGRHHTLIVERGVSFAAFDARDGRFGRRTPRTSSPRSRATSSVLVAKIAQAARPCGSPKGLRYVTRNCCKVA